jgi:hypothetical protein
MSVDAELGITKPIRAFILPKRLPGTVKSHSLSVVHIGTTPNSSQEAKE